MTTKPVEVTEKRKVKVKIDPKIKSILKKVPGWLKSKMTVGEGDWPGDMIMPPTFITFNQWKNLPANLKKFVSKVKGKFAEDKMPPKKAYGGKIKKYAKGGGVRKAARYS